MILKTGVKRKKINEKKAVSFQKSIKSLARLTKKNKEIKDVISGIKQAHHYGSCRYQKDNFSEIL